MSVTFNQNTRLILDDILEMTSKKYGIDTKSFTHDSVIATLARDNRPESQSHLFGLTAERFWILKKRPFFNIHPPVISGLANTPLTIVPRTIPKSIIHELGTMCIKFPIGFKHEMIKGVTHLLIAISGGILMPNEMKIVRRDAVGIGYISGDAFFHTWCFMDESFSRNDESETVGPELTDFELRQRHFFEKLVLGIMLLAADPSFIEPVLLKRDTGRDGDKKKMADRAKRNGVFGFSIGANMEVSPHFRRPHFAIRWTGKGGSVPMIVPVKGSVIHKSQLEVPTGFEEKTTE